MVNSSANAMDVLAKASTILYTAHGIPSSMHLTKGGLLRCGMRLDNGQAKKLKVVAFTEGKGLLFRISAKGHRSQDVKMRWRTVRSGSKLLANRVAVFPGTQNAWQKFVAFILGVFK